jgi:hypothetical protein
MGSSTIASPTQDLRNVSKIPRRRAWRRLGILAVLLLACGLGTREAIHRLPWFGPWLANGLRSVVGSRAVSWLEESTAKLEDRYRRTVESDSPPRTIEQASPSLSSKVQEHPRPGGPVEREPAGPSTPPFQPPDVPPMLARVAAAGDGRWRAVLDPARPDAPPLLFATLLHPDGKRPWAEVFIVAMPVSQVSLHAVAGTREPEATTEEGQHYQRHGLIPASHLSQLLAAFNGGFMTQHGRHGMHVAEVTLVSPRANLCTVLALENGDLKVGTWSGLSTDAEQAQREGQLRFWRQGAPCMYEAGILNPRLRDEDVRGWGATLDGQVVIRRSAIGLDAARRVLYMGVSNDTTARAMAQAMHHAGASDVLQLDVNWSYPKFLLFPTGSDGQRRARGLFEGFLYEEDEYLRRASRRDFFYVLRR